MINLAEKLYRHHKITFLCYKAQEIVDFFSASLKTLLGQMFMQRLALSIILVTNIAASVFVC